MELIKEILNIIDIFTAAYLVYYIITGLCVLKEKEKIKPGDKKHKFAVIIPARNEEKVIANLINSLKKQDYQKELYDVFVVVNNCTDRTKEIVLENNVNLIECKRNIHSKGEALKVAYRHLNDSDFDAYLIFDADNIVHPEFITKMNDALCEGYQIAQGFRDSKNPSSTWISSSYSIHYLIHNIFLNKSRRHLDKSSFINGTGFMITKKFLEKRPFKAHTLTEDIELTVRCAIDGEKIAFVEDAITYDEQVENFKESWKQRKRWSIGTVQCFKIYISKLLKKVTKKDNFSCIDVAIFIGSPLIQFLTLVSYIAHFIITIALGMRMNLLLRLMSLVFGYIASVILSIATIKYAKKSMKNYIKGILTLPLFVVSWLPINVVAFFSRKNKWEQINHTKNVTIDKMLESDLK